MKYEYPPILFESGEWLKVQLFTIKRGVLCSAVRLFAVIINSIKIYVTIRSEIQYYLLKYIQLY